MTTLHRFCCLLLLAGCAGRSASTAPDARNELTVLVGTIHPPRPASVTEIGSALLDDSERGRWVLAELQVQKGGARAVVLEQVITPGPRGTARWRTTAVQMIAPADSLLELQLGSCAESRRTDRSIVALTTSAARPVVRRAWRADTVDMRFRSVDASRVTCEAIDGM